MSSETAPELKIAGYCRACGRSLFEADVHYAEGTIYCAEHAPKSATPRTEGSVPPPVSATPPLPASEPFASAPPPQAASFRSPYGSPYGSAAPPPVPDYGVSPGIAFVLGLIPGVGAIYNGQYAKGLIHVFILGLMFTIVGDNLAGGLEPLVGLLIAVFWAYMPFEAYHTAQKRRQGLPVDEFSGLAASGPGSRFPVAPVLLIVIGAFFLLNNLGLVELRRIIRYWPALLIAAGVYLLWARMSGAQKSDNGGGQG
jgi:hypothetical protein